MRTVIETCTPRSSILQGTFNPEIFTAALGPVIQYYKEGAAGIDAIYTDANAFFTEATYPTYGLKQTLGYVFRRLSGDMTVPSIIRTETAFGGGKTHSLIACVHIANKGKELASVTKDIIEEQYLPDPGSVIVVGIAGDEIPVTKTKGEHLVPYTLWGELAYQVGGEALYAQVKDEAESGAAPGKAFLETVLGGKKVLIMLDELAQYAARLEAAAPSQGASQLQAFIMSLNGYAKSHAGIAIIVTLAGSTDAFSSQTKSLTALLNQIGTGDLKEDDAVALAERASSGLASVVMRDATGITPVQANEISAVLAKRLFSSVDTSAATQAAQEYNAMYQKNISLLPEDAAGVNYLDRMIANYPFHPSLIDFLNNKLAQAENFQGTRGVLRVLAMTVRSVWAKQMPVDLIHVSDIDMQNGAIVDEILGRTGSADLRQVLSADVGSVETYNIQGGLSNAQREDKKNPHPDGIAMYEKAWKVVFLNSLVGRSQGHESKVFGVSQQDAIFQTATTLLVPAQVKTALEKIEDSAFYLRYEDGKYYANVNPTINSVLAMIRQQIDDNRVQQKLKATVDSLVQGNSLFDVEKYVNYPQDISDRHEKPTIGVISLTAGSINVYEMFTTAGDGRPRARQNLVLLLVPKTVRVDGLTNDQIGMYDATCGSEEDLNHVKGLAKQVLAIKALEDNPHAYGISPDKLHDPAFVERRSERQLALQTLVSSLYTTIYFAGASNNFESREIRSNSSESGANILSQIQQVLLDIGELILPSGDRIGTAKLKSLASNYFFARGNDFTQCDSLLISFQNTRSWPIIPNKDALEKLLREGVASGAWVVYKMSGDGTDSVPYELYSEKNPIPINVGILGSAYSIMTVEGARGRHWLDGALVSDEKVKEAIRDVMQATGALSVQAVTDFVQDKYASASEEQINETLQSMLQTGKYGIYAGDVSQTQKPQEIISGISGFSHNPQPDEVIITVATQAERGWNNRTANVLSLNGIEAAKKILPVLKKIGSMYTRKGATSTISELDISDLKLQFGGTLRIFLENVPPESIKHLDEFFQVLCEVVKVTDDTDAEIKINQPDDNCALVQELRGK